MSGRRGTDREYSRRLPPPEAWKKPDKYIDLRTGLALPYRSKLVLPVDDRGFVKTDAAIEDVKEHFFWADYDWPYTPGDVETEPDEHHFYYDEADYLPENNGGSYIPIKFRRQATNIGWQQRQFHNVLHDFAAKTPMPDMEEMEHNVDAYQLMLQIFTRLYESAKETVEIERKFASRRESLTRGTIKPHYSDDRIGQAILRSAFETHFKSYADAVEEFSQIESKGLVVEHFQSSEVKRRKHVASKLGKIVTRNHINYTSMLRAAA